MANFIDLEGVEGGNLEGPIVMGPRNAMKALKRHRAVSGGGKNGAWTVWQDDKGAWHCYFAQYGQTKNTAVFASKTKVLEWLKEFVPKCQLDT